MKIYEFEVLDTDGRSSHKVAEGYMSTCSLVPKVGTISIIDSLKSTAGLVTHGRYPTGNLRVAANLAGLGIYVESLDGSNRVTKLGTTLIIVPSAPSHLLVMTEP